MRRASLDVNDHMCAVAWVSPLLNFMRAPYRMSRRGEGKRGEGKEGEENNWNNSLSDNERLNGENLMERLEEENAEVAEERARHARTRAEKRMINEEIRAESLAEKRAINAEILAEKVAKTREKAAELQKKRNATRGKREGGSRRSRRSRRSRKSRRP